MLRSLTIRAFHTSKMVASPLKNLKLSYDPVAEAGWKEGESIPYLALANTLKEIEENSSRLKMIEILSNFFQSVIYLTPKELAQCIYLMLNQLGPAYEGLELGLGDSIIIKAICLATGRSESHIKSELREKGDLGLIAESSRVNQTMLFKPKPLTVQVVFDRLKSIAEMKGQSTQNKKVEKVQSLIVACRESEARYIVRSLSGKLRIGLAEQSLLVALARAIVIIDKYVKKEKNYSPESEKFKARVDEAADEVKAAYNRMPNFDILAKVLLEKGLDGLEEGCQSLVSIPLKPMLAQPSKGIEEVLKKFNDHKFTCEFKYDGERAQIHMSESGKTYIFSRNQEDTSGKYPDVLKEVKNYTKPDTKSFILDCECVAWDMVENRILPFQVLSTRKRKSAEDDEIKVKVCLFAFDLLHLNEKSLIKLPLEERRRILKESFVETPGKFMFANSRDVENIEDIQEVLDEAIKSQCEGLMVKTLDSTYEIAKRSQNWLKLKKDYLEGVGDTVDAVVIGAYYGKGKRTGTYGGFLLACYDEDNEQFQTVCKLGTGFKDEDLEKHTNFLKEHVIEKPKSYYQIDDTLKPDVWFEPVQVWEIKCADLSLSPVHTAALGVLESNKGISLRFPRYLRIRDDKKPEEATSASQIVDMYNNQDMIQNQNGEN
uniref:DNA ligase n=1 Tax=Aceria tosichella TaxID=561515 RepID=A0A6G1SJ33_9ACAR